jgi:pSer/pThr/pTyr-binding forkhead associated (FHA) protein
MMSKGLEAWLTRTGETAFSTPQVSPGLFDRLKIVLALVAEARPPADLPALVFRNTEGRACAVSIKESLVVGRDPPAKLVLAGRKLSRQHFHIIRHGPVYVIEDLQSRNATFVNGVKIATQELLDGDVIEAGEHVFVFLKKTG